MNDTFKTYSPWNFLHPPLRNFLHPHPVFLSILYYAYLSFRAAHDTRHNRIQGNTLKGYSGSEQCKCYIKEKHFPHVWLPNA